MSLGSETRLSYLANVWLWTLLHKIDLRVQVSDTRTNEHDRNEAAGEAAASLLLLLSRRADHAAGLTLTSYRQSTRETHTQRMYQTIMQIG